MNNSCEISYLCFFYVKTDESSSSHSSSCTAECCHHPLTAPHQPCDKVTLESTRQNVGKKSETRTFNLAWYEEFTWLHLCSSRKKVFCYLHHSGSLTKKYETAFISDGFNNWKKAKERFERHQASESHKEALVKFQCMQAPTVVEQLSTQASRTQATNRSMLLKELSSLQFLLRQGLAIRGHKKSEGNLVQLLELRSNDCPDLQLWLKNHHSLSHNIVNELITLMGTSLLRQLLKRIREAVWFSVMADETRDISNHEQLAICIRWVDRCYEVHEDLIGMVHVESTTSNSLTAAIKDVLICCVLPLHQCRGQAYDGAANMMGHLTGVAKQLLSEEPAAIPVHCLAHSSNLCLQDVAKNVSLLGML